MIIKEEIKLRQWAQDMADQKASGISQIEWCKIQGIGLTAFQYRCRNVRMEMEEKLQESILEHSVIIHGNSFRVIICKTMITKGKAGYKCDFVPAFFL